MHQQQTAFKTLWEKKKSIYGGKVKETFDIELHIFYRHELDRRSGLVVRASPSRVGGRGFDPWLQQTKVFKTGSGGFSPWHLYYDLDF